MKGLFGETISVLNRALDLRAVRNKLLSANIANQETPGFKAKDISFEHEMKKSAAALHNTSQSALSTTDHMHLPVISEFGYVVTEQPTTQESFDRNSVGVEAEMVKLSENSLMYNATARMLKKKFDGLMNAIKEGGR